MEHKPGTFRTSIGGQALIEGILMRGPEKQAIVVRSPEGLVTKVEELTLIKDKYPILGLPILRGAVTFLDSMIRGVKALMFSADYFPDDEAAQPSKLDLWLEKHVPAEKLQNVLVWVSVLLSLGMTLVLFMLLPTFVAGLFRAQNAALHNLIEGVIKVAIFLAYLILCSKQKDVRRVFCYHGAEHKTIFCYEARLPLTVENVRIQPRHHPRCGTSFLFVVIVVAVLASVNGEKITFLAVCGPEAVKRGIKAGDLVKSVCAICGGKGGGKPDSAMGGGSEVLKIDDALAIVDDFVAEKLGL